MADPLPGGDGRSAEPIEIPGPESVEPQAKESLMGRVFGGAEHTPLYVITFLTVTCLVAWIALSIWGPDTSRVNALIDSLAKAFAFFIGLFAGISLSSR